MKIADDDPKHVRCDECGAEGVPCVELGIKTALEVVWICRVCLGVARGMLARPLVCLDQQAQEAEARSLAERVLALDRALFFALRENKRLERLVLGHNEPGRMPRNDCTECDGEGVLFGAYRPCPDCWPAGPRESKPRNDCESCDGLGLSARSGQQGAPCEGCWPVGPQAA